MPVINPAKMSTMSTRSNVLEQRLRLHCVPLPFSAYMKYGPEMQEIYASCIQSVVQELGGDEPNDHLEDLVPKDFIHILTGNYASTRELHFDDHKLEDDMNSLIEALGKVDPSVPSDRFKKRNAERTKLIRDAKKAIDTVYESMLKKNRRAQEVSGGRVATFKRHLANSNTLITVADVVVSEYFGITSHAGPRRFELLDAALKKFADLDDGVDIPDPWGLVEDLRRLVSYVNLRVTIMHEIEPPVPPLLGYYIREDFPKGGEWGVAFVRHLLQYHDAGLMFLFLEAEAVIQARILAARA